MSLICFFELNIKLSWGLTRNILPVIYIDEWLLSNKRITNLYDGTVHDGRTLFWRLNLFNISCVSSGQEFSAVALP